MARGAGFEVIVCRTGRNAKATADFRLAKSNLGGHQTREVVRLAYEEYTGLDLAEDQEDGVLTHTSWIAPSPGDFYAVSFRSTRLHAGCNEGYVFDINPDIGWTDSIVEDDPASTNWRFRGTWVDSDDDKPFFYYFQSVKAVGGDNHVKQFEHWNGSIIMTISKATSEDIAACDEDPEEGDIGAIRPRCKSKDGGDGDAIVPRDRHFATGDVEKMTCRIGARPHQTIWTDLATIDGKRLDFVPLMDGEDRAPRTLARRARAPKGKILARFVFRCTSKAFIDQKGLQPSGDAAPRRHRPVRNVADQEGSSEVRRTSVGPPARRAQVGSSNAPILVDSRGPSPAESSVALSPPFAKAESCAPRAGPSSGFRHDNRAAGRKHHAPTPEKRKQTQAKPHNPIARRDNGRDELDTLFRSTGSPELPHIVAEVKRAGFTMEMFVDAARQGHDEVSVLVSHLGGMRFEALERAKPREADLYLLKREILALAKS